MAQNPMDNMTAKEREEAMGLSESQKMQLSAAGLTAKEIREIHYQRVAESIAKERERLDRLEKKVVRNLPEYLASLLGDGAELKTDENGEYPPEVVKQLQESLPPEEEAPWYGKDDLIMSDEEYWKECDKATKDKKDMEIPSNIEEMSDEDFEKHYNTFFKAFNSETNDVFNRRWLGVQKAWYDWVKGGCKGEKPGDMTMLMGMGV